MKKIWLDRNHVYNYKPFYKQKLKVALVAFVVATIVYFGYQIFYLNKLIKNSIETTQILVQDNVDAELLVGKVREEPPFQASETPKPYKILRGIRLRDIELYSNKLTKTFRCFKSGKEISFDKVNDDYCDCDEDGSDEPGTNACPNGVFYCKYQKRHQTGRGAYISIPSSRVNDGICDCCDASDEYLGDVNCRRTCK